MLEYKVTGMWALKALDPLILLILKIIKYISITKGDICIDNNKLMNNEDKFLNKNKNYMSKQSQENGGKESKKDIYNNKNISFKG